MLPLILGIIGPLLGKVVDTVGSKIGVDMNSDELKGKRLEIDAEVQKMLYQLDVKQLELLMKQTDINLAEAANTTRTWPTWRECLGYVCATAVAYHFVIQQLMAFTLSAAGVEVALPMLEMSGLMTILSAMLGVHFVDSRYNSPMGQQPIDRPTVPVKRTGKLVYDAEAGGNIWKED